MSISRKTEGQAAFQEGRERTDNPHDFGTHDWTDWKDGFDQAEAEQEQAAIRERAARSLMQAG